MNITTDMFKKVKDMLTNQLKMSNNPVSNHPTDTEKIANQPATNHSHIDTSLLYKSHGGLFAGILVLCGLVLVIALFFTSPDEYTAHLVYHISNLVLVALLILGIILGFIALWPLGRTMERINLIDDVLILISMAGYLLLQFFIIISCMYFLTDQYDYNDDHLSEDDIETLVILEVVVAFLESIHCILQAIFVMDSLQRFAKDADQEKHKKGRGIISFLVIVNVCMWIFKSFLIKEVVLSRHSGFYGDMAWPVIMSTCLPLQLFFFFHSSVCLAEVWSEAFEMKQEEPFEIKQRFQ